MDRPGPLAELESALIEIGPASALRGLLVLIACLHIPLLTYPLVYDDGWVLITNGFLREPDFALLLSPEAIARHVPDAFRPTSVLFDVLSYRAFGLDATAHHALSIVLHLGVCALLWRWLMRLGASTLLASSTCLLFGVFALHAEVIAVVSYREDLLAAALGLLAMLAASDALRRSSTLGLDLAAALVVAAAGALACGAKLSAAALPLMWLAFEGLHPLSTAPAGSRWRRGLFFFALSAGVALTLWHRHSLTGGLSPYALDGGSNHALWSERVGMEAVWAASVQIQLAYLGQTLLPLGLSPEYADFGSSFRDHTTLMAALALGSLIVLAVILSAGRRRQRLFAACVLAGAALLLPTANLVPMPNMRADRFTYLSTIPAAIGLAELCLAAGAHLASKLEPATEAPAGAGSLSSAAMWALLPLLVFSGAQASLERAASSAFFSNTTLWDTAQRKAPTSARAHAMFGLMRLAAGDGRAHRDPELRAQVLADCSRAELLDPLEARSHVCFARLAVQLQDYVEAHARFSRAIALDPRHSANWIGARARLSLDLPADELDEAELRSRRSRALAEVDSALERFPYAEELHLTAGRLAHRLGQPDRAAEHYARARSLRPERWESVAAMLELQLDLGHIRRAHRLWLQERKTLSHADPATRTRLRAKLSDGKGLGLRPEGDTPSSQTP